MPAQKQTPSKKSSSSSPPKSISFRLDNTYNEKRIEEKGAPVNVYYRYRSESVPEYVMIYRPEKGWSVRKDMTKTK